MEENSAAGAWQQSVTPAWVSIRTRGRSCGSIAVLLFGVLLLAGNIFL